jgi:hypothetical protein
MKSAGGTVSDSIECPNCGNLIPVSATLFQQITRKVRADLQQETSVQQQVLFSRERDLEAREVKLLEAEQEIEQRLAERLGPERVRLAREAQEEARLEVSAQIRDLQAITAEKDKQLQRAEANELQVRKEKREIESANRALELEVARTLDAERHRIREDALQEAAASHELKDAEKDHKLREVLRVNDELRRKLEQGPQQVQGDVLELELERQLRESCPLDEIVEVPKGIRGADVIQKVNTRSGLSCGLIIWEAKHTKNWNDNWIAKLKDDQVAAKADLAVMVSEALPKDVDGFGFKDGVWITSRRHVPALVVALRHSLSEVAHAKRAVAGKNEVVEALFEYMTGTEFRHRVEAIVRNFIEMKEELDQEKRVSTRRWARREKQLGLIIGNTSGMYGELQALIGSPLKPIAALEFEAVESDEAEATVAVTTDAD